MVKSERDADAEVPKVMNTEIDAMIAPMTSNIPTFPVSIIVNVIYIIDRIVIIKGLSRPLLRFISQLKQYNYCYWLLSYNNPLYSHPDLDLELLLQKVRWTIASIECRDEELGEYQEFYRGMMDAICMSLENVISLHEAKRKLKQELEESA